MTKNTTTAAEWVDIKSITPWDRNPRKNDSAVDDVVKSIERFGFGAPILARQADRVVIAGHTRLKAAIKMGLDKVPVRFLDLDPAEAHALALADNKLGELAEWDDEALSTLLREMGSDGVDIDGLGWSDDELKEMLSAPDPDLTGDDDDEPIPVPVKAVSVLGEVYELGPHRLVCGDSTDSKMWDALLGVERLTLTVTSPPYNVGGNTVHGTKNEKYQDNADDMTRNDYAAMLQGFTDNALANSDYTFVNIQMLASNKVPILVWLAANRNRFADVIVWHKGHGEPAMPSNVMNSSFEFVFIFGSKDNPGRNIKTAAFRGTVSNVYAQGGQTGNEFASVHAATFPVHLPLHLMSTFSKAGSTIGDPFGGTGTTLIACAMTGRTARLIELDPRYCDVIRRRWTRWARANGQDPGPGALEEE